ncbi:MAG: hypothetical protein J6Y49_00415 [Alphaproteobacteria bacterium]|nr:hypothetical protein [Alphaproteobacteria bacterium]
MDDSVAELDIHKILKTPALIIAELKEEAAKSKKPQPVEHTVVVHVPLPKSMEHIRIKPTESIPSIKYPVVILTPLLSAQQISVPEIEIPEIDIEKIYNLFHQEPKKFILLASYKYRKPAIYAKTAQLYANSKWINKRERMLHARFLRAKLKHRKHMHCIVRIDSK